MDKISDLPDLATIAWCFGEYSHLAQDTSYQPDYLFDSGTAGSHNFTELHLPIDKLDFAKITQLCSKSPDLQTRLLPAYIWPDNQHYKQLLSDDPVTSVHFNFTKQQIIHCLCLDFSPNVNLVPAI